MSGSTYAAAPERFEAGTPVISQAVALAAACDYLTELGLDRVAAHERALTARLLDGLRGLDGVRVIGPDRRSRAARAVSFAIEGVHPHDVGQSLDELGIAVRVGHHCAAPGLPPLRRAGHDARVVVPLQHRGRDRRAARRHRPRPAVLEVR